MKIKKYKNNQYLVVRFEPGEEIVSGLKQAAQQAGIEGAFFFGLGVGKELELGYFDARTRDYTRQTFDGEYEFTSLTGNIAVFGAETVIHCHVTITDARFQAYGGHLFRAIIPATLEVVVLPLAGMLNRFHDDATGLKLLEL